MATYQITETTHGFEIARNGVYGWELGHVWTTREQAERDVARLEQGAA